eukprot:3451966-Pleurochrysis_carterae.AAC.1
MRQLPRGALASRTPYQRWRPRDNYPERKFCHFEQKLASSENEQVPKRLDVSTIRLETRNQNELTDHPVPSLPCLCDSSSREPTRRDRRLGLSSQLLTTK